MKSEASRCKKSVDAMECALEFFCPIYFPSSIKLVTVVLHRDLCGFNPRKATVNKKANKRKQRNTKANTVSDIKRAHWNL